MHFLALLKGGIFSKTHLSLCRRRRGWPCVSARQADVGGASRHGCNVVPQKMWMGQAERMKRRTYVKMSTWMQPVVWMRLGRAGLRLQDVSELARRVQPGQSQVAGCFRACSGSRTLLACCSCCGWRGHVGFSAFLSALSSRNRRLGIFPVAHAMAHASAWLRPKGAQTHVTAGYGFGSTSTQCNARDAQDDRHRTGGDAAFRWRGLFGRKVMESDSRSVTWPSARYVVTGHFLAAVVN